MNKSLFVCGDGDDADCNKSLIYKATLDPALVNDSLLSLRTRDYNVDDADAAGRDGQRAEARME